MRSEPVLVAGSPFGPRVEGRERRQEPVLDTPRGEVAVAGAQEGLNQKLPRGAAGSFWGMDRQRGDWRACPGTGALQQYAGCEFSGGLLGCRPPVSETPRTTQLIPCRSFRFHSVLPRSLLRRSPRWPAAPTPHPTRRWMRRRLVAAKQCPARRAPQPRRVRRGQRVALRVRRRSVAPGAVCLLK